MIMKREFEKGEIVFHLDMFNSERHGFGRVIMDKVVEYADDEISLVVNGCEEVETTADRVYRVDEQLQCCRCGCVVVDEWDSSIDYPYYCPDCDENKYRIEVTQVDDEDWRACLQDSIGRFLPEDED